MQQFRWKETPRGIISTTVFEPHNRRKEVTQHLSPQEADHDDDSMSQGTPGMARGHASPGISAVVGTPNNESTQRGKGEPINDPSTSGPEPESNKWVEFSTAEFPTIDFSALAILS